MITRWGTLRIRPAGFLQRTHSKFLPKDTSLMGALTIGASNELIFMVTEEVNGVESPANFDDLVSLTLYISGIQTYSSANGQLLWAAQDGRLNPGEVLLLCDGNFGELGIPGVYPAWLSIVDGQDQHLLVAPTGHCVYISSDVLS